MATGQSTSSRLVRTDITGKKFERLTVARYSRTTKNRAIWLCSCECGREVEVSGKLLRNGNNKSCGCLKINHNRMTHGATRGGKKTTEYEIWTGMLKRCRNKKCQAYPRYGGRGIKVCRRWQGPKGFENFLSDMGPRPSNKRLERVDNDGDYKPSNCKWATCSEQMRNTRRTRRITIQGVTRCITEWASISGINVQTLFNRVNRGWHSNHILRPVFDPRKAYQRERYSYVD